MSYTYSESDKSLYMGLVCVCVCVCVRALRGLWVEKTTMAAERRKEKNGTTVPDGGAREAPNREGERERDTACACNWRKTKKQTKHTSFTFFKDKPEFLKWLKINRQADVK